MEEDRRKGSAPGWPLWGAGSGVGGVKKTNSRDW